MVTPEGGQVAGVSYWPLQQFGEFLENTDVRRNKLERLFTHTSVAIESIDGAGTLAADGEAGGIERALLSGGA